MQVTTVLDAVCGISREQLVNACGALGGILLFGERLPHAYRVTTRGCSDEVSYVLQAIFACGMAMFLVYYGYYNLWPAFLPACLSFACGCYLLVFKAYHDLLPPPKHTEVAAVMDHITRAGEGSLGERLLGEAEKEEDEFIAYSAPSG